MCVCVCVCVQMGAVVCLTLVQMFSFSLSGQRTSLLTSLPSNTHSPPLSLIELAVKNATRVSASESLCVCVKKTSACKEVCVQVRGVRVQLCEHSHPFRLSSLSSPLKKVRVRVRGACEGECVCECVWVWECVDVTPHPPPRVKKIRYLSNFKFNYLFIFRIFRIFSFHFL